VIVSAKIGKAVVRKRASRVLREGYRLAEADLRGKSMVLIARPMVIGKTSTQVAEELRRLGRMLRV
jgi:ribonuclease P protein component